MIGIVYALRGKCEFQVINTKFLSNENVLLKAPNKNLIYYEKTGLSGCEGSLCYDISHP